jgi:membrane protein YdbS with pleckstrin-like domain
VPTPDADYVAFTGPDWHPLPRRSRSLFLLSGAVPLALLGAGAGLPLSLVASAQIETISRIGLVVACVGTLVLAGAALGLWLGYKRYRYTFWRLDDEGLAVRRGKLWLRETRVPVTRVQHLDLKRGPLQRWRDLSTLIVHTAGTRHSAVIVPNLDAADAERLRDHLGRQIDHDDD